MDTIEEVAFSTIKKQVREKFDKLVKSGTVLLAVQYDRDEIWQAYLNGFPEELRQEHNCSCCRAFIRQIGPVVMLKDDLTITSIWGHDSPSPGVRALAAYVESKPIAGLFYHELETGGTDRTPDPKRGVVWEHFFVKLPKELINSEKRGNVIGRKSASLRETKQVMKRGFDEFTTEALDTVRELIDQSSIYRGNEKKHLIDAFYQMRHTYLDTPEDKRDALCWKFASRQPENVCRLRNDVIGQLLQSLSEGEDLDKAVASYERMVAPANYQRTSAVVTPRMIEQAKQRLEELGLISALQRRRLDDRDLTAEHAIYVFRPQQSTKDVFATLTEERPVTKQELEKVEEVTIEKFLTNVVPNAKDIRVLVERTHLGNFVTLTGPQDPEANNLMKWDNSFAWSYTGGLGDSIKEKVKAAGGRVNGWMRASLAWNNFDDLDLHFKSSRNHVYYGNKRCDEAWLDVDMNAGFAQTREPVENITFDKQLKPGSYEIMVHQFNQRETTQVGYELEIEVNGETHSFGNAKSPRSKSSDSIKFKVLPDGQVTFEGGKLSAMSSGTTKWGITTGKFTRVRAITLSPNHWSKPVSNKHYMFLLEGCSSDETTRPFLNEHLTPELQKDRKTMEVLGGKIEVAPAQGAELSGLGFSDTQRNYIYVEVDGAFKRHLKVLF